MIMNSILRKVRKKPNNFINLRNKIENHFFMWMKLVRQMMSLKKNLCIIDITWKNYKIYKLNKKMNMKIYQMVQN
jgi:hypothetical protein